MKTSKENLNNDTGTLRVKYHLDFRITRIWIKVTRKFGYYFFISQSFPSSFWCPSCFWLGSSCTRPHTVIVNIRIIIIIENLIPFVMTTFNKFPYCFLMVSPAKTISQGSSVFCLSFSCLCKLWSNPTSHMPHCYRQFSRSQFMRASSLKLSHLIYGYPVDR